MLQNSRVSFGFSRVNTTRLTIGRENRIAVLSGIVVGQLSQQLSVFTIEIKVRMTCAFGLQITDRHHDLGVAARNRWR